MADFKIAFNYTMDFEDRGRTGKVTGEPNGDSAKARLGINSVYNPDMPAEFWTCPVEQALEMAAIREEARYWKPLRLDQVNSQAIANKLFDEAINTSVHEAGLLVQRALGFALQYVDGYIGPMTIDALNKADANDILAKLRAESKAYYEKICELHPNLRKWLHGYLERAAA